MNIKMKKTTRKKSRSRKSLFALRDYSKQRRTFSFEPLEERLTLSTTVAGFEASQSQTTSTSDVVSLAASTQGSLTVAYLFNADGTTSYFSFSDAARDDEQIVGYLDTDDGIIIVPSDAVFSGTNGLGAGSLDDSIGRGDADSDQSPFRIIPAPPVNPRDPAGGTIALTEVFNPVARTYASTISHTVLETSSRVFTRIDSGPSIELGNLNETGVSASGLTTSQALPAAQGRDIAFEVAYAAPSESMNGAHDQQVPNQTTSFSASTQTTPVFSNSVSTPQVHVVTNAPSVTTEIANHRASSNLQEPLLAVEGNSRDQSAHPFATLANLEASALKPHDSVFAQWQGNLSLATPIGENERFLGTWEIAVALAFGGVFLLDQRDKLGENCLETEQKPPREK